MNCQLLTLRRTLNAVIVVLLTGFAQVALLAACGTSQPTATPALTVAVPPTATPALTAMVPPTATPVPPPSATPTTVATPTRVPSLTSEMLRNTAYPSEFAQDGLARLQDGVYREKYAPDSASEMVISLADVYTFGDLNGDGVEDALVILVAYPGGSGTFFYLAAVLNRGGTPDPVATAFLGDRVILHSLTLKAGQTVVEMITHGPEDSMCCPHQYTRQTYVLRQNSLVLLERVDTAGAAPDRVELLGPTRIEFTPEASLVTVQSSVLPINRRRYVVRAHLGQTLAVTVGSASNAVFLSVHEEQEHHVLVSIQNKATAWTGPVPATRDYFIDLVSTSGSETACTLQVQLTGEQAPEPQPITPSPTPQPPGEKVIYLTFDDGPTGPRWTPQVLALLARYGARATFFVLGLQAERFPELVQAEADAGHVVGNHTYDHHTLDGIGRDSFFDELRKAQEALGDKGAKCLRPPYGATDAYTRAYLDELGYKLVLWNIDTEDWRNPGTDLIASRVLEQARPGRIVLMHDGGGNRTQTVEALETVLKALSEQGYTFDVVCQ